MGDASQSESKKLPVTLAKKIDRFRSQLLLRLVTESTLWIIGATLVLFLICLGFDRLFLVPRVFRFLFLIGIGSMLAFLIYRIIKRKAFFRKNTQLARLIMQALPRFGDRLLGVLELQEQDVNITHFSPQLHAAALQKVSKDAESISFRDALPKNTIRNSGFILCGLLIALGLIAFFFTPVIKNTAARYFLPHKDIARFTYVKFQPTSKILYVAQNEAAEFSLKIANLDELPEIPKASASVASSTLSAEYDTQQNGFTFPLPPLEKAKKLKIKVQDARKTILIQPIQRPAIRSVKAQVRYPEYLKKQEESLLVTSDTIDLLKGSQVKLTLQLNDTIDQFGLSGEQDKSFSLNKQKDTVESTWLTISESFDRSFQFTKKGISSKKNQFIQVNAVEDTPPRVELFTTDENVVLLESEELNIKLFAKDDYGVQTLSLECFRNSKRNDDTFLQSIPVNLADPAERVQLNHLLSPEEIELRPQRFYLFATANDAFPDRKPTYSQPIEIEYLSFEEHAKRLQSQFAKVISQLENLIESEILLEKKNALSLRNNYLQESALKGTARESLQTERNNQKKITQLEEATRTLFQESVRNTPLNRELKIQIAQLSQSIQNISQDTYPNLLLQYEEIFTHQLGIQKTQQEFQKTISEEKELIATLTETLLRANSINQLFESSNFIQRLVQAVELENKVAAKLHTFFNENAGNAFSKLSPQKDRSLEKITQLQNRNLQSLKFLQDDLEDYFKRTQKEPFSLLSQEMEESGYQQELRKIARSIDKNHTYIAKANARKWSSLIETWIQSLSEKTTTAKPSSGSGSGSGSGGGGSPESSGDLDFMLRVIELVKKQQAIREKTRMTQSQSDSINRSKNKTQSP